MEPVKIVLDNPYYEGDSWLGLRIGPVLINEEIPPATLASCRMQFRDSDGNLGYELNTVVEVGKGLITILDADIWDVLVNIQILPLDTGRWDWDFETTDNNGVVRTLYKGILKVIGDITHG
jgi:hypothetical protein